MCGIAGELDWSGAPAGKAVIAAMIDSLTHRGPEGRTCWFSTDGKLALAHDRRGCRRVLLQVSTTETSRLFCAPAHGWLWPKAAVHADGDKAAIVMLSISP
jgi:hypothetical protein